MKYKETRQVKTSFIDIDHSTQEAIIYSHYTPLLNRLYRLIHNYPDKAKLIENNNEETIVAIPLSWIAIRMPKRKGVK